MAVRQVVVCGASAGGVAALQDLVRGLRPDIPAAILVVMHVRPYIRSFLPEILGRAGRLPAEHARDGQQLEEGHIYVAPPNRHLLVYDAHMHLSHGPRENMSRPAINPTLRSVALAYDSRAIGVILSGALDDGTAGLLEVKRYGGVAIVQDPEEAAHPEMPQSAIQYVKVDHIARTGKIATLLNELVNREPPVERRNESAGMRTVRTTLTCPECRGALEESRSGDLVEFHCRVGHSYTPTSAFAAHAETQERTLWAAIVALEEGADLMDAVAGANVSGQAKEIRQRAERNRNAAARLRQVVQELAAGDPTS